MIVFFKNHPCPLCGRVHSFHNHGKIKRLVRDNNSYDNVSIVIFAAFCPISKKAGKPYTKRMLPPFVIPECNITLENSLTMAQQFKAGPINYDQACAILGTCCEKTVRRHYLLIAEILKSTAALLLTWLSAHPLLAVLPTTTPKMSIFEYFLSVINELLSAREKLYGKTGENPDTLFLLMYVLLFKKTRNPLKSPSNLDCIIQFLFDTS